MSFMDSKNAPLYVAIALPILLITAVAVSIAIPTSALDPQHDFLYITTDGYPYDPYDVREGKIVKLLPEDLGITVPPGGKPTPMSYPDIYRYDVQTDTSERISFEDAQALDLSGNPISPDGYRLVNGYSGGGIFEGLFGGYNDYNSVHIEKDSVRKRLNITLQYYYFDTQRSFIGWVVDSPAGDE